MPPAHPSSTPRALYRVFIAPLRPQTSTPLFRAPAFSPSPLSIRTKFYKKDTARHALSDQYVLDSAIDSPFINFVDSAGVFHPRIPIIEAVSQVNRTTQHLVQLVPGRVDEFGRPDPDDPPTCRVIDKLALRQQHAKKLDLARRQAKGHGTGPSPKSMELNWAIAGGDLKHRLKQLRGFLGEGRKVEVMVGPKKRGRKATEEEVQALVAALQDALSEVEGAKEVRREGEVGGVLMMTFEGKKEKKNREKNKKGEVEEMEEGEEGDEREEEGEREGGIEQKTGDGVESARYTAAKRRGHAVR
ncbi:hypothetical protein BDU57DRAFT_538111 [Ampelomyces quisqualis]|uniref:Translation initiation factor IF-3, C-terminal domain-containing protein n=1 Tax=Ampelomyces quisqualis TaxID=50730 RepID=A0A6A5QSZ4_AMPQU|nr:hypothetical protein BDU57DRAFT_538111 [Ampelomyces quisqualis]